MADISGAVTRKAVDSTIIRVYPGAVVNIYVSGTSTLVDSATADENGFWSIGALASGFYDIKVDGAIVKSIHFVKYGHVHKMDESWLFFQSGSVGLDSEPNNARELYVAHEAGSIIQIKVMVHHVTASGDLTIHICKGTQGGASTITFGANSVWNHRVFPGSEKYRYRYIDSTPGIVLATDDVLQMGLDFSATTVEGICVLAKFRPTA